MLGQQFSLLLVCFNTAESLTHNESGQVLISRVTGQVKNTVRPSLATHLNGFVGMSPSPFLTRLVELLHEHCARRLSEVPIRFA